MGEIADMMLDGTLDEQTGEYIGHGPGYPRTRVPGHYNTIGAEFSPRLSIAELKIKAVRKELAILIRNTKKAYPEENENKIVNECRQAINKKYGDNWRSRGLIVNDTNQWTEENNPDWWNEKAQRILQPGMDLGGEHLIGKLADVVHKGVIYHDCIIVAYTGKRGKKRYTVETPDKEQLQIKFGRLSNFKKQEK
jgi:hypothetical protein